MKFLCAGASEAWLESFSLLILSISTKCYKKNIWIIREWLI